MFVVLEGLDRVGKSTQQALLVEKWGEVTGSPDAPAEALHFPVRTTPTGRAIDAHLQQQAGAPETDGARHAVHLLFSANRWEQAEWIEETLARGVSVVCDRYAFSGMAYSIGKGMDAAYCVAPDRGLPCPDVVCCLNLSADAAAARGGYGAERYESVPLQAEVARAFAALPRLQPTFARFWNDVDAGGTPDDVFARVKECVAAAWRAPRAAARLMGDAASDSDSRATAEYAEAQRVFWIQRAQTRQDMTGSMG